MRHPLLAPLLALLVGLVVAAWLPAPGGLLLLVPLCLLYVLALTAFLLAHPRFLAFVIVDVACAAWLLGSAANRAAESPALLAATGFAPRVTDSRFSGVGRDSSPADRADGHGRVADAGRIATLVQSGSPVVIEGTLRQDASVGPSGVSLSIEVEEVGAGLAAEDRADDAVGSRAKAAARRPAAGGEMQPAGGRRQAAGTRTPAEGGVIASVSGSLAVQRLDEWRAGRRVRAPAMLRLPTTFGNPGLRDERLALARRRIHLFATIKSGALVAIVRPASWWAERSADVRAFARRAVHQAVGRWSDESAAIVIAILIGDRAGLTADVERRLQEAGTYHVIAISGGNIAILAGVLLGLGRLIEIRPRTVALMTIGVLVAYADLVGGGASVVRATIMAAAFMTALAFDLSSVAVNALLAAACLILSVTPLAIYDVAFALTFGATLGILVTSARLAPRMSRRWWVRAPAGLLLASAAAEFALLPVGAFAFSRVTFAGLILNFLAIPLMALAQLAGTVVLPLVVVDARLAAIAGYCAHVGASGLLSTAALVDLMPALTWRVPAPALPVMALYYSSMACWFAAPAVLQRGRPRSARFMRCAAVAVFVVSACSILWSPLARLRGSRPTGLLRLTVIDVGQADALLVRFPDARTMLIDTGGSRAGGSFDVGMRVIAPVLWYHDVFRLDYLVLTHGDPDHIGGAVALLRAFPVVTVWEGIDVPRDTGLQEMHREAARRGVPWTHVRAGDHLAIGSAALQVWHPPPPDWERQKIRNDDSIVLEISLGRVSLLLTGDIGADVERSVRRRLGRAPMRIMKVPHHGSAGSSSPPFLAAAQPALAIFTVSAGARDTPALQAVMARYAAAGAQVLSTGEDGAIDVETDGRDARVTTFRGRRITLR